MDYELHWTELSLPSGADLMMTILIITFTMTSLFWGFFLKWDLENFHPEGKSQRTLILPVYFRYGQISKWEMIDKDIFKYSMLTSQV